MSLENPLKNIQIKDWPDYLLAVSGISFVLSLAAVFGGANDGRFFLLLFGGLIFFGTGGKVAHYKYRDSSIKGNANAWFSGWRHSVLADSFALIGVALILVSLYVLHDHYSSNRSFQRDAPQAARP